MPDADEDRPSEIIEEEYDEASDLCRRSQCPDHATCDGATGECVCDDGHTLLGERCVAQTPSDGDMEADEREEMELTDFDSSEAQEREAEKREQSESPDPDEFCHPRNYAIEIIDVAFGTLAGFGQEHMPENVLGPPVGLGVFAAQASHKHLLSLGEGGCITLKMGRKIQDGDGADFIVFENVLLWSGDYFDTYTDVAVVEVSQDGESWHRFPFGYNPDGAVGETETAYSNPDNYFGVAGLFPTLGNCDPNRDGERRDAINPLCIETGGGDAFDLAEVGLAWAAYVRLIDTGHPERNPGSEILDAEGDWVTDWGSANPVWQDIQGFDLDGVGIIHGGEELEADE